MQGVLENGNAHDPYSIAWHNRKMEVVGHVAREVSRILNFFIKRGGTVTCKVNNKARRRSPIEQGGLEILVTVIACHDDEKVISKLKSLLVVHGETYTAPVHAPTPSFVSKTTPTPSFVSRITASKKPEVHVLSSDTDDEPVVREYKRNRVSVLNSDSE